MRQQLWSRLRRSCGPSSRQTLRSSVIAITQIFSWPRILGCSESELDCRTGRVSPGRYHATLLHCFWPAFPSKPSRSDRVNQNLMRRAFVCPSARSISQPVKTLLLEFGPCIQGNPEQDQCTETPETASVPAADRRW